MECYLFVYGTLLSSFQNLMSAFVQKHAVWQGQARIRGRLYEVSYYPGAVADPAADTWIRGELYLVPDSQVLFEVLDEYEGYFPDLPDNSLFIRTRVQAHPDGGQPPLEAWMYQFNRPADHLHWIASGDFLAYERSRK
ncbi:MAG: gamma-glutamylcyclotransferase family protein [Bacteroidia bacterium]|nr:gamma-glutamylcyclotransferase family protein [Bacteroidia bacterium]